MAEITWCARDTTFRGDEMARRGAIRPNLQRDPVADWLNRQVAVVPNKPRRNLRTADYAKVTRIRCYCDSAQRNFLILWRPQRDSNPRYRRERAVSWASRR